MPRYFVLDSPDARMVISKTLKDKPKRITPLRIGPHTFKIYDSGLPLLTCDAKKIVNLPLGPVIFTYPIVFASVEATVIDMSEARFRKLLVDSILNPETDDDEEVVDDTNDPRLEPDDIEDDEEWSDYDSDDDDEIEDDEEEEEEEEEEEGEIDIEDDV